MSEQPPFNTSPEPPSPLRAETPRVHPAPQPASKRAASITGWRTWMPGPVPLLGIAVAALCASNVALWVNLKRAERGPAIAVVGVREMTNRYLNRISNGQITPQELGVRTTLFVAAAQDQVKRLTPVPGQLVLARECVLSGEKTDITPQVEAATDARLAADTGGLADRPGPIASPAMAAQLPAAFANSPLSSPATALGSGR